MNADKEFSSFRTKEFFEIGLGEREIDEENLSPIIKKFKEEGDYINEKNQTIRDYVNIFEAGVNLLLPDTYQIYRLSENEFNMLATNNIEGFHLKMPRLPDDGKLKNYILFYEKYLPEIAQRLNILYFNFIVSQRGLNFLVENKNEREIKYTKLFNEHFALKEKYLPLSLEKEKKEFELKPIKEYDDSVIVWSDEEKQKIEAIRKAKEEPEEVEVVEEVEGFKEQPELEATEGGVYDGFGQKE